MERKKAETVYVSLVFNNRRMSVPLLSGGIRNSLEFLETNHLSRIICVSLILHTTASVWEEDLIVGHLIASGTNERVTTSFLPPPLLPIAFVSGGLKWVDK